MGKQRCAFSWCESKPRLRQECQPRDVQNALSRPRARLSTLCLSRLQDRIDGITIQARQFQDAGHFDAENIKKKQEALVARYEALKEPMVARKQKLADSLRLQQLFRDVEDEETWIREKEPIAASRRKSSSERAYPYTGPGGGPVSE